MSGKVTWFEDGVHMDIEAKVERLIDEGKITELQAEYILNFWIRGIEILLNR